jgi:hypothetical protein
MIERVHDSELSIRVPPFVGQRLKSGDLIHVDGAVMIWLIYAVFYEQLFNSIWRCEIAFRAFQPGTAQYQARFDFDGIARREVPKIICTEMDRAIARALATQKPRQ